MSNLGLITIFLIKVKYFNLSINRIINNFNNIGFLFVILFIKKKKKYIYIFIYINIKKKKKKKKKQ